ncbi:MAG: cysteine--tRNA ligase, partial [Peptostreptococcaceae bacterium]|nr:cysteine--tRNA ligase [Peptostreptococcaceae bacterium]
FDLVKIANTNIDENSSKQLIEKTLSMLNELTKVINIAQTTKDDDIDIEKIEQLIDERNEAKKNKDFAKADEIRDTLKQMGIEIKDTRKGTQWSRI